MVIYDITKEIFSTKAYPGDPVPEKKSWLSMEKGDVCNLTSLTVGSHSGTHIDAPKHFIANGKSVAEMPLEKCVGICQVVSHSGKLEGEFWKNKVCEITDKLLIRGNASLDVKAAETIVACGIHLVGVEAPTVGDSSCQQQVHKILLENEVVILENLCLDGIQEGQYFLAAQPLKMQGVDGSPVRALLMDKDAFLNLDYFKEK